MDAPQAKACEATLHFEWDGRCEYNPRPVLRYKHDQLTQHPALPEGAPSPEAPMPKVHVLHENPEWLPPFAAAFDALEVDWTEWLLTEGTIDLDAPPPEGIFYSRMSASSHTRGHAHAKDYTRSVLSWLEAHGRTVINGRRVLELEMSKVDQHAALRAAGFDVPRTIAVIGRDRLIEEARRLPLPFITKHNQGGRGLGVQKFEDIQSFEAYVTGPDFEQPVDGITLLQEYVRPADGTITRVEIVGGEFLYALRADTSQGFTLCPADNCEIDELPLPPRIDEVAVDRSPAIIKMPAVASAPEPSTTEGGLFHWRDNFEGHPIIQRYLDFCAHWNIGIAGIEFIESADGRLVNGSSPKAPSTSTPHPPRASSTPA